MTDDEIYDNEIVVQRSEFQRDDIAFTYKLRKIKQIVDYCIPDHFPDLTELPPPHKTAFLKKLRVGLQAISESNSMQGHRAPDRLYTTSFSSEKDKDIEQMKKMLVEVVKRDYEY